MTEEDFFRENYVTQLGYSPLRIDILNAISGVAFGEAFEKKIVAQVDEITINFINL